MQYGVGPVFSQLANAVFMKQLRLRNSVIQSTPFVCRIIMEPNQPTSIGRTGRVSSYLIRLLHHVNRKTAFSSGSAKFHATGYTSKRLKPSWVCQAYPNLRLFTEWNFLYILLHLLIFLWKDFSYFTISLILSLSSITKNEMHFPIGE